MDGIIHKQAGVHYLGRCPCDVCMVMTRVDNALEMTTFLYLLDTLKLKASLGARTYVFNQVIQ